MTGDQAATTGEELLTLIVSGPDRNLHLERGRNCVLCGQDCSRVALQQLAYVFEACDCGRPDYQHLVESLMHRHGCPQVQERKL